MTDIPHSNATLKIIIFTSFMLSLSLFYHAYSHLCSSTLNVFSLFFSVDYDNLPKVDVSISLSLTAKWGFLAYNFEGIQVYVGGGYKTEES